MIIGREGINMEDKICFVKVTMEMPSERHKKLKSICALTGKTVKEVVNDLVQVFITAVEKDDE